MPENASCISFPALLLPVNASSGTHDAIAPGPPRIVPSESLRHKTQILSAPLPKSALSRRRTRICPLPPPPSSRDFPSEKRRLKPLVSRTRTPATRNFPSVPLTAERRKFLCTRPHSGKKRALSKYFGILNYMYDSIKQKHEIIVLTYFIENVIFRSTYCDFCASKADRLPFPRGRKRPDTQGKGIYIRKWTEIFGCAFSP